MILFFAINVKLKGLQGYFNLKVTKCKSFNSSTVQDLLFQTLQFNISTQSMIQLELKSKLSKTTLNTLSLNENNIAILLMNVLYMKMIA